MKSALPENLSALGVLLLSSMLTLAFAALSGTLITSHTSYFASLGLEDPSRAHHAAGWWIGIIISLTATFWFFVATLRFYQQVFNQFEPYDEALKIWNEIAADKDFDASSLQAEATLKRLKAISGEGRICKVIASWDDASPNSDAEAIIEGEALPYRNFLNFFHTLASVLVLIGLVGNFFGLAKAAASLPDMVDDVPVAAVVVVENKTKNQQSTLSQGTVRDRVSEETGAQAAPVSNAHHMKERVEKVASGLSVVVVSSVMGIGSMIILLIMVSWYRGIFGHLVSQEIMLMSVELGTALRPAYSGNKQVQVLSQLAAEISAMKTSWEAISQKLTSFDQLASSLAAGQSNLGSIIPQLDEVIKQQLVKSHETYQEYKDALLGFQNYLEARTETLHAIMDSTGQTSSRIAELAEGMKKIQDDFAKAMRAHQKTQAEYENYAQLVRSSLESYQDKEKKHKQELVEGVVAEFSVGMNGVIDSFKKQNANSGEVVAEMAKDLRAAHELQQEYYKERLDAVAYKQAELVTILSDALRSLREEQRAVQEQSLVNLNLASEALSRASRDLTESFETTGESLLNTQKQAVESFQAQHETLIKSWVESVPTLTKEIGEFSESALLSLKGQMEATQGLTNEIQAILHKGADVLEDSRRKLVETQDRWKTSQDLVLEDLFQRWSEQFARVSVGLPEFRESLEKLNSLVVRLGDYIPAQSWVCPECSALNNEPSGFCSKCDHSLDKALPLGAFPVKTLTATLNQGYEGLSSLTQDGLARLHEDLQALENRLEHLPQAWPEPKLDIQASQAADLQPLIELMHQLYNLIYQVNQTQTEQTNQIIAALATASLPKTRSSWFGR